LTLQLGTMSSKKDIQTRADLERMLEAFYKKVFKDELIGHFFTEVVPLNLDEHLPMITDFWESIVFGLHTYQKNVLAIHQHIHQIVPIEKKHLDRWVEVFHKTVDEFFEGGKATMMKKRAVSIATFMNIKLNNPIGKL
jgi:hemoglobin